ncbi:DUF3426 domain-containing protein [Serpens gallinarum]|uniref:DUF3426 domain-containing protein n=1 Tax=Serpens gallinarum TaxID=2763075 RepID=A0ABR8TJS5_9PSED|nr:DUF3426 domain-containing protein [Serpens gallinarum]MBD7975995.1 DUF3426 domain-containing protein [Serpens gallinarum]
MTETFVAQCPHCRTSFRVSRAQLGAAHGAVRCGACLHVFNAARQVLGDAAIQVPAPASRPTTTTTAKSAAQTKPAAPGVSPPAPTATPAAPRNPVEDDLRIHDDLDLGDMDLDRELERLEQEEHQLSQQFLSLHATDEPSFDDAPDAPITDDEAWAEALLDETTDSKARRELHIEPALGELEPEAPTRGARSSSTTPKLESMHAQPDGDLSARHYEGGLDQLNEPPLQLEWQRPKKPWGRWIGWSLLILLALLGLAAQYVYYHYAELARQDRYRPWFEQLCPLVGCSLPSKVDITQIKSSNLVVRSHPRYTGALIVDAILYNRAAFAQPFPLLEMRFSDINGQLLASRRFKPSEYLSGELAGQREMPPQTPIHISLDILDPGAKAVNYSLGFHSPE